MKVLEVISTKSINLWPWKDRRECTAERFLLNPYSGCQIACPYCYTRGYSGRFFDFWSRGILTVYTNYPERVRKTLERLYYGATGYLSPSTDPFQPVNQKYKLSEKLIQIFLEYNLPVEVVTKRSPSKEAISLISKHRRSFFQISILTTDTRKSRKLAPLGSPPAELLKAMEEIAKKGTYLVARIDPIIPGINDEEKELNRLVRKIKEAGAKHIVTSVLDIPIKASHEVVRSLDRLFPEAKFEKLFMELYVEKIGGYLHANINYRKKIFSALRQMATENGLTFALCMEFERIKNECGVALKGLNEEFATSKHCEGAETPLFYRTSLKEPFKEVERCDGNCLRCKSPVCGLKELAIPLSGKLSHSLSLFRKEPGARNIRKNSVKTHVEQSLFS